MYIEGRRVPFTVDRMIRECNPSADSVIVRNFSQCGKSEHNMNWLMEQLKTARDPNLFYPDPELARQRAESEAAFYRSNPYHSKEQVDRLVKWLTYEYSDPRPINLFPHKLSIAIAAIILHTYSR
jgi:hypothetical protein